MRDIGIRVVIDRKLKQVHQSRQRDNVWAYSLVNESDEICYFEAHVGVLLRLYATSTHDLTDLRSLEGQAAITPVGSRSCCVTL